MIKNLHVLRAVAALMVVYVHIGPEMRQVYDNFPMLVSGNAGVDIFFVLSGFLMVLTTEQSKLTPLVFYFHRIARIAPLYWAITTVICLAYVAGMKPIGVVDLPFDLVLRSYLFLPVERDGLYQPIVYVGWTLIYEVFFYFIFGAFVSLKDRVRASVMVTGIILALVLLPFVLRIENSTSAWFYTRPIMLDFVFGIWLARLSMRADLQRLPASVSIGGILAGILLIVLPDITPIPQLDGFIRPLTWGVGGSLIILVLIALERQGRILDYPFLITIGSASYAIYLTHPLVLHLVSKIASRFADFPVIFAAMTLIGGLGLILLVGVMSWRLLEAPMHKLMRKWLSIYLLRANRGEATVQLR